MRTRFYVLALGLCISTALTACAAEQPPAGTSQTPLEVSAIQEEIVRVHQQMLKVLQQMATLDTARQQQIGALMVDQMAETSSLLASMQPVTQLMTEDENRAAALNLGRIRSNISDMSSLASLPVASSGAATTGRPASAAEMAMQMDQLHQRLAGSAQQLSTDRIQGIAANMVDLSGNLDRLKGVLGGPLGRMSPGDRQAVKALLVRMDAISFRMIEVAGHSSTTGR